MVHCKQARRRPREPAGVPGTGGRARAAGGGPAMGARAPASSDPGYMRPTSSSGARAGREMAPMEREAVFGGSTPRVARATCSSAQKSARGGGGEGHCACRYAYCSFKGLQGSLSPPQLHHSSTTTAPDIPLPAAPANMADAAGATPLLPGLPDEIAIWEILVRLPPKPLLRCRAVSPAWRRATSTRDFLLSHHACQPALHLLYSHSKLADGGWYLDIVPFDHRAGVAAADRFQSVARLKTAPVLLGYAPRLDLQATCDGLLVLATDLDDIWICNPATREYAPLKQLSGFRPVQIYPHPTTGGEYRLLVYREPLEDEGAIYVFTIGSGQPPRNIGCPDPTALRDCLQLLFQGSIYWYTGDGIMVFDTTDESFRQIRIPFAYGYARLFEMGDMLGILSLNGEEAAFDIWVMQDYQGEVWDFKCVELPVAETRQQCQCSYHQERVMVVPGDGGLLLLLNCDDWLFQVDVDGKLTASFQLPRGLNSTHYVLKQTLVQHTFFPTLEGYVVNTSPFF